MSAADITRPLRHTLKRLRCKPLDQTAEIHSSAHVKMHFIVVNQNVGSNSLGRALSMALVARELGETSLISFGRGKIWPGVSQFDVPITRVSANWKKDLDRALKKHEGQLPVIWLSKGLDPLPKVAAYVRKYHPHSLIVLDLDDDDVGLASAFRNSSLTNYLRLPWFRRGNPWRVRKSQNAIAAVADGFTFSTHALATLYPDSYVPNLRVPHVRPLLLRQTKKMHLESENLRFGCFGTLRPHKGSQLLLDIMRADRNLTLVTFRNCGLGTPAPEDVNWLEIDPKTPLHEAYEGIDVAVIPITDASSGAQFQLPAKIVDAMRAGVPIVATVTPAIQEIAGSVIVPLSVDQSVPETIDTIRLAARSGSSHLMNERFVQLLTPVAAAEELAKFLQCKKPR